LLIQDINDYAHIPILAKEVLPSLTRVDAWTAPFTPPSKSVLSNQLNSDNKFTKEVMKATWGEFYGF